MATWDGHRPPRSPNCLHKLATSCCLISLGECCACADRRPHTPTYRIYIDGVGFVYRGTRWQNYCWNCKVFWDNRIAASDPPVTPNQSRIPDHPDQSDFLLAWAQFDRGYRVVTDSDGRFRREDIIAESLKDVNPGVLPRLLDGSQSEPQNVDVCSRERDIHLAEAATRAEEPSVSLDQTLDELLLEAESDILQPTPTDHSLPTFSVPETHDPTTLQSTLPSSLQQLHQLVTSIDPQVAAPVDSSNMSTIQEQCDVFVRTVSRGSLRGVLSPTTIALCDRVESDMGEFAAGRISEIALTAALDRATVSSYTDFADHSRRTTVFGTREEVQSDTYVSPITDMFSRAYAGYLDAEAERRAIQDSSAATRQATTAASERATDTNNNNNTNFTSRVQATSALRARPVRTRTSILHGYATLNTTASQHYPEAPYPPLTESLFSFPPRRRRAAGNSDTINTPAYGDNSPAYEGNIPTFGANTPTSGNNRILSEPRGSESLPYERWVQGAFSWEEIRDHRAFFISQREQLDTVVEAATPTLDGDNDRPAPKTDAEMKFTLCCRVCLEQVADTVLLPCGHLIICQWCAKAMFTVRPADHTMVLGKPQCPACRRSVRRKCRVYVSGFDGEGSVSTADKGSANEASKDVNLDADEAEELEFVDASEVMIVDSS